jgi:hypothetical protein
MRNKGNAQYTEPSSGRLRASLNHRSLEHCLPPAVPLHRSTRARGKGNRRLQTTGEQMRIIITTDGGFTGRGIGSATADLDDEKIAGLRSEDWRDQYDAHGADLIQYTLRLGERAIRWSDGAQIPRELQELFDEVWANKKGAG